MDFKYFFGFLSIGMQQLSLRTRKIRRQDFKKWKQKCAPHNDLHQQGFARTVDSIVDNLYTLFNECCVAQGP